MNTPRFVTVLLHAETEAADGDIAVALYQLLREHREEALRPACIVSGTIEVHVATIPGKEDAFLRGHVFKISPTVEGRDRSRTGAA